MDVAIIGSGNVGTALARSAARAGHNVTISSKDSTEARKLAKAVGGRAAGSNEEAVGKADVAFLAVPANAVVGVAAGLGEAARGKVLVDVTNRPTPAEDGRTRPSIAEEVQALAPDAHVVKAINTIFAARQAEPDIGGTPADGYVAGDDPGAKETVLSFVESIGLTPYDVGPLAVARTLEGMAWIHISLAKQHDWPWKSAWKIVGPKR
jgi:8-hydroxy-5-deazaflavin:NADPH oxidoreductase